MFNQDCSSGKKYRFTLIVFAITVLATVAFGQEKLTANTMRLGTGASAAPASLKDMQALVGHWKGDGLGGTVEEIWSAPESNAMMAMFRLVRKSKPVFYEFMTLVEENRTLVLRIKHFNPDMTAWEEKDMSVDFRFINRVNEMINFEGLSFRFDGVDRMTIFLALQQKDGSYKEMVFTMRRVSRGL